MSQQLELNPDKIPTPSGDDMMEMFRSVWKRTCTTIDNEIVFKRNMRTLKLDGSEDNLASSKLMQLVGDEMVRWYGFAKPSSPLKFQTTSWCSPKTFDDG